MKKIKIFLVVVWMIIIFLFSNEPATKSSKRSDKVIKNTILRIINNDSDKVVEKYTKPVRKFAHFSIYLILGFLVFNCFNLDKRYIFYASLICFLYSVSDEVHQYFIPGRSCEIFDIFIDTIGSLTGIISLYYAKNKISKK